MMLALNSASSQNAEVMQYLVDKFSQYADADMNGHHPERIMPFNPASGPSSGFLLLEIILLTSTRGKAYDVVTPKGRCDSLTLILNTDKNLAFCQTLQLTKKGLVECREPQLDHQFCEAALPVTPRSPHHHERRVRSRQLILAHAEPASPTST
jgi:hypothetical protein